MAINDQGIMALPTEQAPGAAQLSLQDSYSAMREGLQEARPDADMELQEALAEIKAEIQEISDEQLDELISAVQSLYDSPETYAQEVAQLVADGDVDAEDLPPEYDEEFLAAMLMVLIDEQRSRQSAGMPPEMAAMMPPQQFARGGIAEAARMVASQGRRGDTMLAHITPSEARLLKARGGSGTINPQTGLPEFFIKKIFKAVGKTFKRVGKAIKSALKSPIGRIIATVALGAVLGPAVAAFAPGLSGAAAAAVTGGLSSGIVTAASGGDLKDVLKSAALGAFSAPGGPVSNYVGKYTGQFLSNPVVKEAANAALIGTAGGLLTGESLKDSLKTGLTSGVIAGGVTIASGGTTAQASQQAANTAADAVDNLSTQSAIDDFYGVNKDVSGAAAQKNAFPARSTQVLPDGRVVTMTGNQIDGGIAAAANIQDDVIAAAEASRAAKGAPFGTPRQDNLLSREVGLAQQGAPRPSEVVAAAGPTAPPQMLAGIDYEPIAGVDFPYGGAPGSAPSSPSFFKKAGDLYDEYISPSGIEKAGKAGAEKAYADTLASTGNKDLAMKAYEAAKPGILATYGPATALGIGALGLAGGFSPKQPDESDFADQMRQPIDLSSDPSKYYVQGLPGVQYGSRGEITGSSSNFSPYGTMADVRVPGTSYINYQPRFMNKGGIAALAQGGYPRRIGQIDGPGTETSDSIPAMLSDGEFVMTARAVRGMGNGSRRDGAKKMYALMHQLEKNAARG